MPDEKAMMAKMKMMMMVGVLFALVGVILHVTALVQEFGTFAPLQEQYWSVSKGERDAAATGSDLANQLTEIQKFPPRLMTFKLVGIGAILVGIFTVLFAILKALTMMPKRLGMVICPQCGKMIKKGMPHKHAKRRKR